MPMIPPHKMIYTLYNGSPEIFNEQMFGREDGDHLLKTFWGNARATQPWMLQHPGWTHVERDCTSCIPLRLHGDEVVYNKMNAKVLVTNLCSSVVRGIATGNVKMLIYCGRPSKVLSWDPLLLALRWSLLALISGVMPACDEHGNALTGPRSELAGKRIAGKYHFLLDQIAGDPEYLSAMPDLEENNYQSDNFCFLCRGTTSGAAGPSAWDYSPSAAWTGTMVSNLVFLAERPCDTFFKLPGFALGMVRPDLMHVLALGILHWCLGSAIYEMIEAGWWTPHARGPWDHVRAVQLREAFKQLHLCAMNNKLKHSQCRFTLASFSMTRASDRPYLKGKAANLLLVARWASSVALEFAGNGDAHADARANTLWGYVTAVETLQLAPMVLEPKHREQLEICRSAALRCHGGLSWAASRLRSGRWLAKPKHHMVGNIFRTGCADNYNPIWWWCFQDESFVGMVSRCAKSCHGGIALEIAVIRKFRLKLAMRMRRHARGNA